MKRLTFLLPFFLLLAACQARQLVRVPLKEAGFEPPRISGVKDLGSLAIPGGGVLDQSESDGVFVAGEWFAVLGGGLNGKGVRLYLDTTELPIAGGLEGGGLLSRLPRDLKFRHTYTLRVETGLGRDQRNLPVTNLLAMSDPREGRVLFWRTTEPGERKELFDEDFAEVACPGAGPGVVAGTGGIYYVAGQGHGARRAALRTIHLGAKDGPKEVAVEEFDTRRPAVSLVLSTDGSHAYLLTGDELLLFDLSVPESPRFLARQELAPPEAVETASFTNLVLFDSDGQAAMLDAERNLVRVLDFSRPDEPTVLGDFQVGVPAPNSYCVALTADPGNGRALRVLTGVNTRQLRQRLFSLWSPEEKVEETPTRCAITRMVWKDGKLYSEEPLNLPEGLMPLGLYSDINGDMLISSLAYEKDKLSETGLSWSGAGNLLRGVRESLFAGRIYRMTPDGTISLEMKSINIPLSISRLEDSPLIYSIYRLSIRYVFLSAKVVLAVDALKKQSLPVREMGWKTILPPYKFMHEIILM